jgi:hypothetical protein
VLRLGGKVRVGATYSPESIHHCFQTHRLALPCEPGDVRNLIAEFVCLCDKKKYVKGRETWEKV